MQCAVRIALLAAMVFLTACASSSRPVSYAASQAYHADKLHREIDCGAHPTSLMRWRVKEYRFGGQSHLYFEQQARQADGTWEVLGGLGSDELEAALAPRRVDDVTCKAVGDGVEIHVSVSRPGWDEGLCGLFVTAHPDNRVEFETCVITGSD